MRNPMKDLINRAAIDLARSSYAIALTGAGISTESGVPDYRGPSGVWTKNPEAEKKAYRTYELFLADPKGWWEERLSAPFGALGDLDKTLPNSGHYALAELEQAGILKRIITQNIDNLHQKAGSVNVLDYHGNSFKLRCISCCSRYEQGEFNLEKLRQEGRLPPLCPNCNKALKIDVVNFGEAIPSDVAEQSLDEVWKCDLMLICGTSAVIYPFAELPRLARQLRTKKDKQSQSEPHDIYADVPAVTIIEINVEPTPLTQHKISDYLIQGKTGEILPALVEEVKRLKK
jgi:NAD-dependent deacetylase